MKKTRNVLLIVAALLAALAFVMVSSTVSASSRRVPVVVARTHLLAGAIITPNDVDVREVHPANVPPGALESTAQAVGQRVLAERLPGDILTTNSLGEAQSLPLAEDEVAIGVHVNRITGLSGLLRPGDRVAVIGVIASTGQHLFQSAEETSAPLPYARIYLRGLRVLFIHHEFAYSPPAAPAAAGNEGGLVPVATAPTRQAESSVVVLAAPVAPQAVSIYHGNEPQVRFLSPAELLAMLNANGVVHLALEPLEPVPTDAYGIQLKDLLPIPDVPEPEAEVVR